LTENKKNKLIVNELINKLTISKDQTSVFIEPSLMLVVLDSNHEVVETYYGPQYVSLSAFFKKNKLIAGISFYAVKMGEIISDEFAYTFTINDYKYQSKYALQVESFLRLKVTDFNKFIKFYQTMFNAEKISDMTAYLINPEVKLSINRAITLLLSNLDGSILNIYKHKAYIEKITNKRLAKQFESYGFQVEIDLSKLFIKDSKQFSQLKEVLLKRSEMDILNYTYQNECLDLYEELMEKEGQNNVE